MAQWSKNKQLPQNTNNGNEYEKDDQISIEAFNGIVNNSFHATDIAESTIEKGNTAIEISNAAIDKANEALNHVVTPGNGTVVTEGGVNQATWDADSKAEKSYIGQIIEFDYMGITESVIPASKRFDTLAKVQAYFGGTWESYASGRMLIGQNTDFPIGTEGGEKRVTLTIPEMPSHSHYFEGVNGVDWNHPDMYMEGTRYPNQPAFKKGAGLWEDGYLRLKSNGNNQSHENMSPYRTVYRWRRIA